jgi:protein SCO1/2
MAIVVALFSGCASEKSCCRSDKGPAPATTVGQQILDTPGRWKNDAGKDFDLTSLRGQPVVISMFYASCEGICLVTRDDMRDVEASLPESVRARAKFVLVTLAPDIDTASVLKQYRRDNGLSEKNWIFLRGSKPATAELASRLGIAYWRDGARFFRHTSEITVLDESGKTVLQQDGIHANLAQTVQAVTYAIGR